MSESKSSDIFLNGKAQVIEMLKHMRPDEKERLIRQIRRQSTGLANELSRESIGFEQIGNFSEAQMRRFFTYVQAPILGMAIRGLAVELQKRVLSTAERSYAEEAYEFMTMNLEREGDKIRQAREKAGMFVPQTLQRV